MKYIIILLIVCGCCWDKTNVACQYASEIFDYEIIGHRDKDRYTIIGFETEYEPCHGDYIVIIRDTLWWGNNVSEIYYQDTPMVFGVEYVFTWTGEKFILP